MKAALIHWHKAQLQERYVLETKIHRIEKSERCPDGIRYGLILMDEHTNQRVLMDNHHPKGHHIHIDDKEWPYQYVDEIQLMRDFKALVFEYMGVKI